MATRSKDAARSELPMRGHEVAAMDDIADRAEPPAELNALENLVVLTSPEKDDDGALEKVKGYARAMTPVSKQVTFGHIASVERAELPNSKALKVPTVHEPFLPKWSGVSFAPKSGAPRPRRLLRRRSGALVRPEWVFPPDNRQIFVPDAYPWRIIGRIFVWTNASAANWTWWGTASLVGKRTIMTASHVVPWGSGSNWKALFVPAYYDGQSRYGANAASWVTNARGYDDHDQGDDMAVMRLAQPLGDWLGYFGYKTYNDDWEDGNYWTIAGYPWDVASAERPCAHYWFPITDDDNDGAGVELEYRADTEGGSSGGPVFGWWSGKPYVVGTHSGGEDNFGESRQNVAAGGSALSSLIGWARTNWT